MARVEASDARGDDADAAVVEEPSAEPAVASAAPRRISVVIPAKNEALFLPKCLGSLSRLEDGRYADVEVIVVDNGSTDGSQEIARSLGATVLEVPARTIGAMRNHGAKAARGGLVAFLDADCTAGPGWLENASAHFGSPDVVATGSYPEAGGDELSWIQRWWAFLVRKPRGSRQPVHWLGSANLIVRKSAFDSVGGFDESLESCEDVDLCCRLVEVGTILYDDEVRVYHHREPRTLWQFFRKEIWHGKNSYDGLLGGRLTPAELPSLVAPAAYLIGCALIVAGLALAGVYRDVAAVGVVAAGSGLALVNLPALAYTARALLTKGKWLRAPTFFVIYSVYFTARAISLVRSLGSRLSRAGTALCVCCAVLLAACGSTEPSPKPDSSLGGLLQSSRSRAGVEKVTLAWDPPTTDAEGQPLENLAGFRVYDGTAPGQYSMVTDVGLATEVTLELAPGTYYITVVAVSSSGVESEHTPEIVVEVPGD